MNIFKGVFIDSLHSYYVLISNIVNKTEMNFFIIEYDDVFKIEEEHHIHQKKHYTKEL